MNAAPATPRELDGKRLTTPARAAISTLINVTGASGAIRANPEIGRAGAMRRAITVLIARGDRSAHPAVWAPFAVVGEGEPQGNTFCYGRAPRPFILLRVSGCNFVNNFEEIAYRSAAESYRRA